MNVGKDRYKLIEECYNDVERYLNAFDLPQACIDEAIQETFVEAFSKAHTLRDESKVKNWIIRIAKSKGMKHKEKKKLADRVLCVFEEEKADMKCAESYSEDILSTLITRADDALLVDCLSKLADRERNVIILQYIYREKLIDIALIIGESLTNTKTISRRAKAKLKEYLIEGGYENGK